jgi:DNA polymerase-3 subunit delta
VGRTLQRYKKLFDDLKKKGPVRLYLLYGPEDYIKKEFVGELIKMAVSEENRTFNLDILHGDEFQRDAFHDRLSAFPLFADRRMVIVRKFDALSTANKDFVIQHLDAVPDSMVFVAETGVDKMDTARMKTLKKLADAQGLSFRFEYLSDDETIERIRGRLKKEGFTIEPDALDLLLESVGTQLIDVVNELEKIVLAAGEATTVTRELVGDVVGRYRTENLFSFLDALGSTDTTHLVRRLNRLIDSGEEPVFVLAMLIRRIALLLQIRSLLEEKGSGARAPQTMSRELAGMVSPYFIGKLVDQAERFDSEGLHGYLENLRWADVKLKSTSLAARGVLETSLMASHLRKRLAPSGPVGL